MPWAVFWLFLAALGCWTVAHTVAYRRRVLPLIFVLALLMGLIRGGDAAATQSPIWNDGPEPEERIRVSGVLVDEVRASRTGYRLRLQAEETTWGDSASSTPVLIDVYTERIAGSHDRAFDGFRYGDKYSAQGIFRHYSISGEAVGFVSSSSVLLLAGREELGINVVVGRLRETLSTELTQLMPGTVAGLAAAMTVGDRRRVPSNVAEAFRSAGLSHILAISGLHVSIIGGIFLLVSVAVLGRRGQYYLLMPLTAIWGYAILAGLSPSVVRAATMFSIVLLSYLVGRQRNTLPALGLTGAIMLAIDPLLLGALSFQLSFAAVTGIAIFTSAVVTFYDNRIATPERRDWWWIKSLKWLYAGLATSFGATLMTVPIVASTFGGVPVFGAIATLLTLPILPYFVITSLISSVAGVLWQPAGQVVAYLAIPAGYYVNGIAELFAAIPFALVPSGAWPIWGIVSWYAVIAAFFFRQGIMRITLANYTHWRRWAKAGKPTPLWVTMLVLMVAALVWGGVATQTRDDTLSVTFFDVSLGDMILITTPAGTQVLIDGGRDASGAYTALDNALPFWDRSLDLIILTHPDADHLGGLQPVLDRYRTDYVLDSAVTHDTALARSWKSALANEPGQVLSAEAGMLIGLAGGGTMEVLWAGRATEDDPINDGSTVIRLVYGDVSFMLTGDISTTVEADLVRRFGDGLQSTVLKVAHHGSDTSSAERFLRTVGSSAAVIQAGYNNRFGHPTDAVLARLQQHIPPEQIWVTKDVGAVVITTDGQQIWSRTLGQSAENLLAQERIKARQE